MNRFFKLFLITLLFFFSADRCNLMAQTNLVLNPSFEDTTGMTVAIVLYSFCNHWWSPNGFTSDYFSIHCEALEDVYGTRCVPCSSLGCQDAQDGNAYAGLVNYENNNPTKEYAQGFLSEPMVQGVDYCVGIWLALADSASFLSCDFQVAFTDTLILDSQANSLFLEHYVDFDLSGLSDQSWTYFEGSYTAIGGEQYIYIGSNTPNPEITCVQTLTPTWLNNASYILVDNVSVRKAVVCDSGVGENDPNKQPFIFPNPSSGFATVGNLSAEGAELDLFDGMGRWCTSIANRGQVATLDMRPFERGVYFLRIEGEQDVKVLKVIKQ